MDYEIGTVYDDTPTELVLEWRLDDYDSRPYLKYCHNAAKVLPHLQYLVDWMEVSAPPVRWRYLRNHKADLAKRAVRTNVCMVDFRDGELHERTRYNSIDQLVTGLNASGNDHDNVDARVFVVEDLSRDVIEALGARFAIEPTFFRSQISDYLWFNIQDRTIELPEMQFVARRKEHMYIRNVQPRFFRSRASFDRATANAFQFNVMRRLDRDYNERPRLDGYDTVVAMLRSRTSFWIRSNRAHESGVLAVLVVDPSLREGHALWGGYRNYHPCPEFGTKINVAAPKQKQTLFEEVVEGLCAIDVGHLRMVKTDPKVLALPLLRVILAEWLTMIKYIDTRLRQIDWELERPELRRFDSGNLDSMLRKLHFWRRHVPNYRAIIAESIDRLFSAEEISQVVCPTPIYGTTSLLQDFKSVLAQMDGIQTRIERIFSVATAIVSIEEARGSVHQAEVGIAQNKNLTLLTNLATVFIPMSFVAAFFSMQPDVSSLTQTYWIYFIVSLPLTVVALLFVDFLHVQERMFRWWLTPRRPG